MNANELADELDKFSELGGDVFFGCCADMLRQQADEIIKLKLEWQYLTTKLEEYSLLYGVR